MVNLRNSQSAQDSDVFHVLETLPGDGLSSSEPVAEGQGGAGAALGPDPLRRLGRREARPPQEAGET